MKTRNVLTLLLVMVAGYYVGCAGMDTAEKKMTPEFAETEAARRDVLYTCNCGPQCTCNTVSTKAGRCACGAPLKWSHVLKTEGSEVLLCQCREGCRCYGLDNGQYKCGCGVPVKRVDLQGTDIYFCNCGSSCYCNTVSTTPEKCRCGARLKKG